MTQAPRSPCVDCGEMLVEAHGETLELSSLQPHDCRGQFQCVHCGETLVRRRGRVGNELGHIIVEAASSQEHKCWETLPEEAEHLRISR